MYCFSEGCPEGQELSVSGMCAACPLGTYKDTNSGNGCTKCPLGWTTPDIGSNSRSQCTTGMIIY